MTVVHARSSLQTLLKQATNEVRTLNRVRQVFSKSENVLSNNEMRWLRNSCVHYGIRGQISQSLSGSPMEIVIRHTLGNQWNMERLQVTVLAELASLSRALAS
ncbi:MAG: hypothetical protein ACRDAX_04080 [Propionibacteriaceae bacterium]